MCFFEEQKVAAWCLQLQGEVVLIADEAGVLSAATGDHFYPFVSFVLPVMEDLLAEVIGRMRDSITGQIGNEKAALTVGGVTFDTMRAFEKQAACFCISGNWSDFLCSLQISQIGSYRCDLITIKNGLEGRHAGSGYAITNDALKVGVGSLPKFCDVRGVFATLSIQPVTTGARGIEELLSSPVGLGIKREEYKGEKQKSD